MKREFKDINIIVNNNINKKHNLLISYILNAYPNSISEEVNE